MRFSQFIVRGLAGMALAAGALGAPAQATAQAGPSPDALPSSSVKATLDLATTNGARTVAAEWRYRDVRVTEVDFRAPGVDRKPSGPANRTYDIDPHAGDAGFDDSAWERIAPETLEARRAGGKLCFAWYRIRITLPEQVGDVPVAGMTVVFETVVDDYAEIWVDGQLPRALGQMGGNLVAGWNAPNRAVLTRDARPGQQIQIAVFAANGPLSDTPSNYIWMRSAKLTFHRVPHALAPVPVAVRVDRKHPDLDAIVPPGATMEKLAEGFTFVEGPVWLPEGALLFSDPNENVIWKWTPDNTLSLFRDRSGYAGGDIAAYRQPGSNGLTLDPQGRLTIDQHGNRRVVRLEPDGSVMVLADRYLGKRLNSPNDLIYRSDGTLFFTDPPFGLPRVHDDPRRELAFAGVYSLTPAGKLQLVSRDFRGPNGIALSADEKTLYVANWDEEKKIVMRYDVRADGTLGRGTLFCDLTSAPGEEALDGLKVDRAGNVYVSGPVGVWVFSPRGTHLGTLIGPELAANFAWGDADGKTLYLGARGGLYRMRLAVEGVRPQPQLEQARR